MQTSRGGTRRKGGGVERRGRKEVGRGRLLDWLGWRERGWMGWREDRGREGARSRSGSAGGVVYHAAMSPRTKADPRRFRA